MKKIKGQEIMSSISQHWKEEGIEIGTQEGIRIGEALGEARGEVKRNIEIAKKLLSKDYSVSDISKLTGLSITDIQKLRS